MAASSTSAVKAATVTDMVKIGSGYNAPDAVCSGNRLGPAAAGYTLAICPSPET